MIKLLGDKSGAMICAWKTTQEFYAARVSSRIAGQSHAQKPKRRNFVVAGPSSARRTAAPERSQPITELSIRAPRQYHMVDRCL